MKHRISVLCVIAASVISGLLGSAQSLAQYAYITNQGSDTVSVVDVQGKQRGYPDVIATIPVGHMPYGVAVAPDGSKVYVTNEGSGSVSVIATNSNTVTSTIPLRISLQHPRGVAVTPDGSKIFVADGNLGIVSIIDAATNTESFTIGLPFGDSPEGVAVTPDGKKVYVTNGRVNTVSVIAEKTHDNVTYYDVITTIPLPVPEPRGLAVTTDGRRVYVAAGTGEQHDKVAVIDTLTDVVAATIPVGSLPQGVALSRDGSRVFVSNYLSNNVSVIDTATNKVIFTVGNGTYPGDAKPFGLAPSWDGSLIYVASETYNWLSIARTDRQSYETIVRVGSQPVAFGNFLTPPPIVLSAPPTGRVCSGPFDGTISGNLTVSAGQDCRVVNGGQVTGNVTVSGGNFVLSGGAVGGSVSVNAGSFTLGPAATIDGDVQIENLPPGDASNSVCGTTVQGSLQVDGNAAAVQIGSGAPLVCAGNKIGGDLVVDGNSAKTLVFDNQVTGALQANNNTGVLDVVGNTVGTTLQCQNNTMLIMGGNNTTRQKTGQCD